MLITELNENSISEDEYLLYHETILENDYLPFKPYPKQSWIVYEANRPNVKYKPDGTEYKEPNYVLGGAGGFGGKTFVGSMLAAQYLTEPDYSCLVTRKNYGELVGIDSIFQNLVDWVCDPVRLGDLACTKVESPIIKITSPFGAEIHFKAFDHENKKQKLKSESYNRIINDEASELVPNILTFQNRSLRQPLGAEFPLSVVNLSNPGGPSTDYLVERFVDGKYPYIAIDWRDNPYIDKELYESSLDQLDKIDKEYQKYGNWHYKPRIGDLFNLDDLEDATLVKYKFFPHKALYSVISIDLASTGADTTAISLTTALESGKKVLLDINEDPSPHPEEMVYNFVEHWNPLDKDAWVDKLVIEQEPGSDFEYSRKYWENYLEEFVDNGLEIDLYKPDKSKYQRARPLSRAISQGSYFISNKCQEIIRQVKEGPRKGTNVKLLDELFEQLVGLDPEAKKGSPNLVDSVTQGFNYLDKYLKDFNKPKHQFLGFG
jgi:hypothetical protein